MADISKIKLPSGDTYNLKDSSAVHSTDDLSTVPIMKGGTGETTALEAYWALKNRGYCSDANGSIGAGLWYTDSSTTNLPAIAYSQNNGNGILLCDVSTKGMHDNSTNWIWQVWLNTTTLDIYRRNKVGSGSWSDWVTDVDTNTTYTFSQDQSDGHKLTLTPSTGAATTITIPDNNTTYTLSQDAQDGHKITLTPSTGSPTTITIPDNNTTYTGASPIAVSGTTISHAISGVTAASKGDTTNQTPTWGGIFKATSGTVNATGHLTAYAEHTVTIPSSTATTSAAGLMSAADKATLDGIPTQITGLLARMDDLEDVVLNFDPSDADAALYSLALRVSALESHALLDSTYPTGGPSNPSVSLDNGTLSIS